MHIRICSFIHVYFFVQFCVSLLVCSFLFVSFRFKPCATRFHSFLIICSLFLQMILQTVCYSFPLLSNHLQFVSTRLPAVCTSFPVASTSFYSFTSRFFSFLSISRVSAYESVRCVGEELMVIFSPFSLFCFFIFSLHIQINTISCIFTEIYSYVFLFYFYKS